MTNEGITVSIVENCPLCKNKGKILYQNLRDRLFGAPGIWNLMYCANCEIAWLNPMPVPEDIPKLYKEYFTHEAYNPEESAIAGLKKLIKYSILKSTYGYHMDGANFLLGKLLSLIGPLEDIVGGSVMYLKSFPKGRLLDVGCGNGFFLYQMKKLGWEVVGVEPDGDAVKVAHEKYGLEVFQGTLEDINFPENSFDVITMNHVIEHVPDPFSTLKECKRVLKPGGKVVVITPNIKSLANNIFGKDWRGWESPRHLFLFSSKSLKACAEHVGLTVDKLWTVSKSARYVWWASRKIKREGKLPGGQPKNLSFGLKLEGFVFWALEYLLCKIKDVGEEIVMIAKKED